MAEEIKENEVTQVSTLDMDPESKRLFNVRKVQKGKKPQFKRTCSHKFKRLDSNWRRPRGLQGKQRRKYLGKEKLKRARKRCHCPGRVRKPGSCKGPAPLRIC